MSPQVFFEDIEVGMDVPELVKTPSTRQLVKWAGGTGDYNEIHFDQEFARSAGLPDIIVHGKLKAAFLTQMITDWIGNGTIKKISVRFREMDNVRQRIVCRGTVTARERRDGENWVECEAWTENLEGKRTVTGSFAFTLPSKP